MFRRVLAICFLALACLPAAAEAQQSSHLKWFGYFGVRLTESGGNHLPEVADRSNLNWVRISDRDGPKPQELDGCAPAGCTVSTGDVFFTGCDDARCKLKDEYRAEWQKLARAIGPRIGKVGAFILKDEPQHLGASAGDVHTSARTIKETFPNIPVMMIEAGKKVTPSLKVSPEVDWVGFDHYCEPFSAVRSKLAILDRLTKKARKKARPRQKLFLVPEAAPLKECGGKPGHRTDADIAALQWKYFNLAEEHPRVIGLLNFGFWVPNSGNRGSAQLPRTVAAHRKIAARIIRRPAAPPAGTPNAAPRISRLKVSKRIRKSRTEPRTTRRRKGQTISFRLSEAANVTLSFGRARPGRLSQKGRRRVCGKPTRRNRGGGRCVRFVRLKAKVPLRGRKGMNRIVFHGRLSQRKALGPGDYRVSVAARDADGVFGKSKRAEFQLVR